MNKTQTQIWEEEGLRVLSKCSPELLKITGKHSTLWSYSKLETMEKLADLLASSQKDKEKAVEEARTKLLEDLDIVWVCPPCAKKYFNKNYTDGKTNIYTAVHRKCEACHQQNQCMHHRSYDD